MDRIVIVGAGLAGHRAGGALLRAGFRGELTIVGDEPHLPYDRPPLSKQILGGSMEDERCFFSCDDLGGITWRLGAPAVGLDLSADVVALADGGELPFDGLVIASGRRARELPGLPQLDGVHTLRTLDDSRELRAAAASGRRVAIIGAGFIGCEVAATLRAAGAADVALIDVASHPMPVLGEEVGGRAAELHGAHGVELHLGTGVAGVEGNGRVRAVELESGARVPADLVLVAVGSAPNSEWLSDSGLELRAGTVVCDEHCVATGTDNVVAAGDVASWPHPGAADGPVWIEHWTNARDMGATAARNLLAPPDERKVHATVPTFWSDQYDVKIKSAGFLNEADRFEIVEQEPERNALVAEAYRDGHLVGAVAFNRTRKIIDYQRQLGERPAARG